MDVIFWLSGTGNSLYAAKRLLPALLYLKTLPFSIYHNPEDALRMATKYQLITGMYESSLKWTISLKYREISVMMTIMLKGR